MRSGASVHLNVVLFEGNYDTAVALLERLPLVIKLLLLLLAFAAMLLHDRGVS